MIMNVLRSSQVDQVDGFIAVPSKLLQFGFMHFTGETNRMKISFFSTVIL